MPVRVVAEIGCNWRNLDEAKEMIAAAKTACAWAVKFQLFKDMTIQGSPYDSQLRNLILSEDDVTELHKCAEKNQLALVLTPMYPEAVNIAAKYADYIKIRFKDHENQELIKLAEATGKPLFISVPRRPINRFETHISWFYCLNAYPPSIEDFNLETASTCNGFSSHFPHTVCDLAFAINRFYADSYIEKHVMLTVLDKINAHMHIAGADASAQRQFKQSYSSQLPIDAVVSVTFGELATLISQIALLERMKRTRL